MKAKLHITFILLILLCCICAADENNPNESGNSTNNDNGVDNPEKAKIQSPGNSDSFPENLNDFSFVPAFYLISYKDEVLQDSKDIKIRSNGKISSSGSKYSTAIGLETHYDIAFLIRCKKDHTKLSFKNGNCDSSEVTEFTGHTISPYIGLYDFNNGINGLTVGILYGYWKADSKFDKKSSLNIGLGWTVHKDRLVLADGINEGDVVDATLDIEDYTERKDIKGITLMISASIGF